LIDKIIVVDNCSTDESYNNLIKHKSTKVEIIQTQKNGGYAYGNNFGVKYVKDNFLVDKVIICNPDVIFREELISKMIEVIEEDNNLAQITALMKGNSIRRQNIGWKLPSFKMQFLSLFWPINHNEFDKYIASCKSNESGYYVDVIPGSFFMIKIRTFLDVGLFDERTFLYGEEDILSYKIKKANKRNFLLKNYSFTHIQGKSINKSIKNQRVKFHYLNKSRFIYNRYYLKINIILAYMYYYFFKLQYSVLLVVKRFK
jgi:GT2 family glycosyltransferase